MRKLLVTGGTVFVSRYVAEYYAKKGDGVYVLNRNHHTQPEGTTLIEADRRSLKIALFHEFFFCTDQKPFFRFLFFLHDCSPSCRVTALCR